MGSGPVTGTIEMNKRYWIKVVLDPVKTEFYKFGDDVKTTVRFKASTGGYLEIQPRKVKSISEASATDYAYYTVESGNNNTIPGAKYTLYYLYPAVGNYVVSFNPNPDQDRYSFELDSIPEIGVQQVFEGAQLPNPEATGWDFVYWMEHDDPSVHHTPDGGDFYVTKNMILDGSWLQSSYSNHFELQQGEVEESDNATISQLEARGYYYQNKEDIRADLNTIAGIVPTREWFTFDKWNVIGKDTQAVYGSVSKSDKTLADTFSMPAEDLIFRAEYVPNSYSIQYNLTEGSTFAESSARSAQEVYKKTDTGFAYETDATHSYSSDSEVITLPVKEDVIAPVGKQLAGWKKSGSEDVITTLTLDSNTASYTLTPVWEDREYSVLWDFVQGNLKDDATYSPRVVTTGEPVVASYGSAIKCPTEEELTRLGYKLTGWNYYVKNDSSGEYEPSASPIDTVPAADIRIEAIWSVNQYKVTYHLDDTYGTWNTGGNLTHPFTDESNHRDDFTIETIRSSGYPIKSVNQDFIINEENYTFEGWYSKAQIVEMEEPNKGDNKYLGNLDQYEKDLATFQNDGWDPDAKVTGADEVVIAEADLGKWDLNTDLYSRFKVKTPEVTFDLFTNAPCGEGAADKTYIATGVFTNTDLKNVTTTILSPEDGRARNFEAGSTITLPTSIGVEGYDFTGWEFYLNGSKTPVEDPATVLGYKKLSGGCTLKLTHQPLRIVAVYTPKTYTVSYHIAAPLSWKDGTTTATAKTDSYSFAAPKTLAVLTDDSVVTLPDGYEIIGWYEVIGSEDDAPERTAAFSAWRADEKVTADVNEFKQQWGDPVTEIRDEKTGNRDYYAIVRRKTYQVVWNLDLHDEATLTDEAKAGFAPAFTYKDGTSVYVMEDVPNKADVKAPALTGMKKGYTFKGWYIEEGRAEEDGSLSPDADLTGSLPATVNQKVNADSMTVYAVWEPVVYNITYEYNYSYHKDETGAVVAAGQLPENAEKSYIYTDSFTLPEPKELTNKYQFKGWYTARPADYAQKDAVWDESTRVVSIREKTTGNIKLYARWETKMVTLEWDTDGGTVIGSAGYTQAGTYEYGTRLVTVSQDKIQKRGYTFSGWSITGDENGTELVKPEEELPDKFVYMHENIVIKAVWTVNTYNLDYQFGVDENKLPVGDFSRQQWSAGVATDFTVETADIRLLIPEANKRPDLEFAGWYTQVPDGYAETPSWELTGWDPDKKIEIIRKGTYVSGVTVYARWTINNTYTDSLYTQKVRINAAIQNLVQLMNDQNDFTLTREFESRLNTAIDAYDKSWYKTRVGIDSDDLVDLDRLIAAREKFDSKTRTTADRIGELITSIGTVTLTDTCKAGIDEARAEYDKYKDINAVKKLLDGKVANAGEVLQAKEQEYKSLAEQAQKDAAAAAAALSAIQAIGDSVSLSQKDKAAIDAAAAAYEKLTDKQKTLLPSTAVDRLNQAKKTYQNLATQYSVDTKAATGAETKLNLVPSTVSLTDSDKALIEDARKTYDSLTSVQKAMVSVVLVEKLKSAEKTYGDLEEADQKKKYNAAYKAWDKKNTTEAEITKKIKKTKTDSANVGGASYAKLKLKAVGQKNGVKLSWKKVKKASGYLIYGAEYGSKMKLLGTVGKKKRSWTKSGLKSDTYYKYIVVAYKYVSKYDAKSVLTTSETVYAATADSRLSDVKSVMFTNNEKSCVASPGETLYVKADAVMSGDGKTLVGVRYESSNPKVATVDKNGIVKCKKAGKALIYAIAQNGKSKSFKVLVKKQS